MATKWPHCLLQRIPTTGGVPVVHTVAFAWAAMTGAAITFTPKIDCRMLVVGTFDVECVTPGAIYAGSVRVNTVVNGATLALLVAPAGFRTTVTQTWTYDLTAGVSYAIDLVAALLATVGQYNTHTFGHGGMVIELVPKPEDGP